MDYNLFLSSFDIRLLAPTSVERKHAPYNPLEILRWTPLHSLFVIGSAGHGLTPVCQQAFFHTNRIYQGTYQHQGTHQLSRLILIPRHSQGSFYYIDTHHLGIYHWKAPSIKAPTKGTCISRHLSRYYHHLARHLSRPHHHKAPFLRHLPSRHLSRQLLL